MKKKISLAILYSVLAFFGFYTEVQAVRDLKVACPSTGTCTITAPSSAPYQVFDATDVFYPGADPVSQYVQVSNTSSQNGYVAFEVDNYEQSSGGRTVPTDFDFGDSIDINIYRGSVDPANLVYGGVTLSEFRDDGYFTIDTSSAGQTTQYFLVAEMKPTMGSPVVDNYYQGGRSEFDLRVGLELQALPPSSGGGDGSGGTVAGTSTAQPPTCEADAPSSAPSLSITNVGTNTVSLSWTAVSPVTHYALVFTRVSDGEQYGSTNIGNVTSYTVTNLSGGDSYTFEVFGVNDCAPGPRSGGISTGNVPGPFIAGRPTGPGGEVLGVTDEEASPTPEATESTGGEVAGATDEICGVSKLYIPWILLIAQLIFLLVTEYFFKADKKWTKYYIATGITLASIVIFYLIRECQCYDSWSWLVWLCKWYFVVSILLTLLMRTIGYAFIEEIESPEDKKKLSS